MQLASRAGNQREIFLNHGQIITAGTCRIQDRSNFKFILISLNRISLLRPTQISTTKFGTRFLNPSSGSGPITHLSPSMSDHKQNQPPDESDRDSSRKNDDGFKIAGEDKKKKKEEQKKRKAEREAREEQERRERRDRSGKRRSPKRSKNADGGTQSERRHTREEKLKKGFTNKDATSGAPGRVPLHKPVQLAKGVKNTDEIRAKQQRFRETFARIVANNSGNEKGENETVELGVFKDNKKPFTRVDQWTIQFAVMDDILEATTAGKPKEEISHNGTWLQNHQMVVYTTIRSAPFFKAAINKIKGFQAYMPEEWPAAVPIYCLLPGIAGRALPNIAAHFAAGTYGGIAEKQVRVPRAAWKPAGDTESYRVYLEVDEDALNWLSANNYSSYIGLYLVRWEHPPVQGLRGRIDPGTKIEELLKRLEEGESSRNTNPAPPPPPTNSQENTGTVEPAEKVEEGDTRGDRHVSGASEHAAEEEILSGETFEKPLQKWQEVELLNTCSVPKELQVDSPRPVRGADEEDSNRTITFNPDESMASSPVTSRPKGKARKRLLSNGKYASDASEAESEGDDGYSEDWHSNPE